MLNFKNFAKNVEMLKHFGLKLKNFEAKYIFFRRQFYLYNF